MIHYFAYGSNMNLPHFRAWLRRFGVRPEDVGRPRHAILHGFKLRTNYLAVSHCAGACNVEPADGQFVEGVLLVVTSAARDALRRKEGWPRCYAEIEIELAVPSIGGSAPAITYIVTSEHRLAFDLPVTPTYRRLILSGAEQRHLSPAYQAHLRRVLKPVPDRESLHFAHILSSVPTH